MLEKTKTIQCHERRLEFLIPKHSNESICLLTQLKAWFNATPFKSKNHPVFLHLGGVYEPLSRRLATPPFKNALATAGVNPKIFGWSSFRRGSATTAFIATNDVESLRVHGDWQSDAYKRYLALPAASGQQLVSALQSVNM